MIFKSAENGTTSPLPFVSCLAIAGKDEFTDDKLLPNAIESFLLQDWPAERRELVIVHDGPKLPDLAVFYRRAARQGSSIHLVHLTERKPLGALRNISMDAAKGDFMAQWDADDFSHPHRIFAQMEPCLVYPDRPTFLQRQLTYDFETNTACIRDLKTTFIHGSIVYPRTTHRYPEIGKEEDTEFLKGWTNAVILDNDPALYVRLSHSHNTWDRRHILREFDAEWARGQWHICLQHAEYLTSVIERYQLALANNS